MLNIWVEFLHFDIFECVMTLKIKCIEIANALAKAMLDIR